MKRLSVDIALMGHEVAMAGYRGGPWRRFVCRVVGHDLSTLVYPPLRREECRRCREVIEHAPSITLERAR